MRDPESVDKFVKTMENICAFVVAFGIYACIGLGIMLLTIHLIRPL